MPMHVAAIPSPAMAATSSSSTTFVLGSLPDQTVNSRKKRRHVTDTSWSVGQSLTTPCLNHQKSSCTKLQSSKCGSSAELHKMIQ